MSSRKFKPPSSSADSKNAEVKGKNYKLQEASADTPSSAADSKGYTFTGVTPGKAYLHPPDRLVSGRVMYRVKFAGHMIVKDPRGSELAKNAIDMLLAAAGVKKANTGEDMESVILSVSIRSIMCTTSDKDGPKKVLHQHPLHTISFSADDKRKKGNIFTYIARSKPPSEDHICYVFECTGTQAAELTATVGQAFELAYKEFLKLKQAQQQLKELKQRLETCSPEEKEGILQQITAIEEAKAKEVARLKEKRAKEAVVIAPSGPKEQKGNATSTGAGARRQTSDSELESAFTKIKSEIDEAYSSGRNRPEPVVPKKTSSNDDMMRKIEEKLKYMEASGDDEYVDEEIPDVMEFPATFAMGSFVSSSGGPSSMPKRGSVKAAASAWNQAGAP